MNCPHKQLLLWDIDGTLFFADRAGEIALLAALRRLFGVECTAHGIEFGGRTDCHIVENLLVLNGFDSSPEQIHAVFEAYVEELERILPTRHATLLPGVLEILETVAARPDLIQGLLTGNLQRGAQLKLAHFDAWRFFEFGAFGEESADRSVLANNAVETARKRHACAFPPSHVWVIGDTPHDIACGKAIGANTIAVASGHHDLDALGALNPTALLPDLRDTAAFLQIFDHPPV